MTIRIIRSHEEDDNMPMSKMRGRSRRDSSPSRTIANTMMKYYIKRLLQHYSAVRGRISLKH